MSTKSDRTAELLVSGRLCPGDRVRSLQTNTFCRVGALGTVVGDGPALRLGDVYPKRDCERIREQYTLVRWDNPRNEGPWREADLLHGSVDDVWWMVSDELELLP